MLKTVGFPSTRTGDQTIVDGNLVIATSGKGIDFSATPGTGTSELLSDYEEGTWTPNVTSQGGSLTEYTATGLYTKVGRTVTLTAKITITTSGTATGQLQFTGLPFACNATSFPTGNATETAVVGGYFGCYLNAGGGSGAISSVTWTNGAVYNLTVVYQV